MNHEEIWSQGYLSGDSKRIFLNTSLGCSACCKYCYLPYLGYNTGVKISNFIPHSILIEALFRKKIFKIGIQGTIISLGCFSECWDSINIEETKKIIEYFLPFGNPIQVATKRFVNSKEILRISKMIQWYGQFTFFISCATVKYWGYYEKETEVPQKRFNSFNIVKDFCIPAFLYIKPVIDGITIEDSIVFADVMKKYNVDAVVGNLFISNETEHIAPVGRGLLFNDYVRDESIIRKKLSRYGTVYKRSIEPINKWRSHYVKQRISNERK